MQWSSSECLSRIDNRNLRLHLTMTHSFTFSGFREALFGEVRMFPAAENTRSDLELAADTAKMTLTRFRKNWKLDCSLCASQYESWSIEGITKKLAHSLSIGWLSPCSLKTELLLLRCLFSLASSFSLVYFLIISLTVSFSHFFNFYRGQLQFIVCPSHFLSYS